MPVSTRKRPAADPYAAPALEKGLDILELLAAEPSGLTQTQIAERLGRSHTEIFRMLVCLQRRGYLTRTTPGDAFALSARLFELSHRHPPTRSLLELASPVLKEVADAIEQSCHLSIEYQKQILVIANADSPGPRSLSVRVGTRFDLAATASGIVLMAWKESVDRIDAELRTRIDRVRRRGYEQHRSRSIRGVIDISCPVRDARGTVVAAITVPYLTRRGEKSSAIVSARDALLAAAAKLSALLGHTENQHE
jgi:DNA-binding IclR family transcriptional regulator